MTALMSQVTCALCCEKIDESKWKDHIVSTKHLLKCKTYDSKIATKFFEKIFEARPDKRKKYNLKIEKTLNFWQIYLSTKLPKEKFDTLCNDPIDKA